MLRTARLVRSKRQEATDDALGRRGPRLPSWKRRKEEAFVDGRQVSPADANPASTDTDEPAGIALEGSSSGTKDGKEAEVFANDVCGGDEEREADDHAADDIDDAAADGGETRAPRNAYLRTGVGAALVIVLAVCGLTGWFAWRSFQSHEDTQRRATFVAAARQGAIDLTTIDYRTADSDIKRILDSATGAFRDDFQNRSGPFVDAVKQAQSVTEGTVNDAGLESANANDAVVLVSVSVKTMNNAAPQQKPRSWRMRISVERQGNDAKVSNVEFVV